MNLELQGRILALLHADAETRARLVQTGELFDGYNAEMERVHTENAAVLERVIDEVKQRAASERNRPPEDFVKRQADVEAWARAVGWVP